MRITTVLSLFIVVLVLVATDHHDGSVSELEFSELQDVASTNKHPGSIETRAQAEKIQNRWNKYYSKVNSASYNKKHFKTSQAKQARLNEMAEKARLRYVKHHERMQKRYANDDQDDIYSSSNDAFKSPYASGAAGSWGPSGTPGTRNWYTDGVTSRDARVTRKGKYVLGPSRRRIGAGFGRRRRTTFHGFITNGMMKKAAKGKSILKTLLKKGSKKPKFTADEKKALIRSKAGLHPKVDKAGRFVTRINKKILGKDYKLLPDIHAKAENAYKSA